MNPGVYKGRVVEAVLACTEKGSEYIGVTLEVAEGEYTKACITAQFYWTQKAEEYSREALKKLGWAGETRNVDGHCHLVIPPTIIPFGVKLDEYNGKTSLKVDWVVSPPSGVREGDKLTGRAAADLLGRIRGDQRQNGARASARNDGPPPYKEPYDEF